LLSAPPPPYISITVLVGRNSAPTTQQQHTHTWLNIGYIVTTLEYIALFLPSLINYTLERRIDDEKYISIVYASSHPPSTRDTNNLYISNLYTLI